MINTVEDLRAGGIQVYKKMLVPLDGSELAEEVFVYAKELSVRLGLDLTALHVAKPSEEEFIPMHLAYLQRSCDMMTCEANALRESENLQKVCTPVQGKCEVAVGYPAEQILSYAEENDIDIILMATHGRSGVRRWALGSVAEKVLRASKVPVWLARSGVPDDIVYDKWPSRTILVPLDGSKLAEQALPHAEALAKQRGAELVEVVLLRVCEDPFVTADYPEASMPVSWEEHVQEVKSKLNKGCADYLRGVEERLAASGLKVRSELLTGGRPSDRIIAYVKNNPFNLIVMCTHGRSGINRLVNGSVADRVLRGVSNPIFLVRPQ